MSDLLLAFLEADLAGRTHAAMGDELARLALALADRARAHWAAAHACLDAAENCARLLARNADDPEGWPPALEQQIRDVLEARDEGKAA